jgi:hypothetical protein
MPQQFWKLTLAEFNELVEGYKLRNKMEWERTAQLAVWIMQPHVKEKMSVDKLIKLKDDKPKISEEKQKERLDGLFNELG